MQLINFFENLSLNFGQVEGLLWRWHCRHGEGLPYAVEVKHQSRLFSRDISHD